MTEFRLLMEEVRLQMTNKTTAISTILFLVSAPVLALGCRGHETVALIALTDMQPAHAQATNALLAKFPPTIHRACSADGLPVAAAEATWPDDYRMTHEGEATGSWHFLDVPLDKTKADLSTLCADGCVVNALRDQIAKFKEGHDSEQGANALRFIIHLVGDAHQPLHAESNNDRGGNCIPTDFLTIHAKRHLDSTTNKVSYDPELHSVWDKYIIDRQVSAKKPTASDITSFAGSLYAKAAGHRQQWGKFSLDDQLDTLLLGWVMESHALAVSTAYSKLVAGTPPRMISARSLAGPAGLNSCEDEGFQDKIAEKHVAITKRYVATAGAVLDTQLEKAGIRLARILDQLWDSVPH